jgi:hypothetical protein
VPSDYLSSFPKIQALRKKVASIPAIAAFYEQEVNSGDDRKTFKADA